MALDDALMENAATTGQPVLRFYSWTEPAATFGYSQPYAEVEKVTLLRPLIRRPTGGGLVPHDADWTYSLAFPPDHWWYELKAVDSYRLVHEWLRDAFAIINVSSEVAPCCRKEIPGQCFLGWEQYDLLRNGRKIAGAAQRRSKSGLLIQGSVQPPIALNRVGEWQNAMRMVAKDKWSVDFTEMDPALPPDLRTRAVLLRADKFSTEIFNRRR